MKSSELAALFTLGSRPLWPLGELPAGRNWESLLRRLDAKGLVEATSRHLRRGELVYSEWGWASPLTNSGIFGKWESLFKNVAAQTGRSVEVRLSDGGRAERDSQAEKALSNGTRHFANLEALWIWASDQLTAAEQSGDAMAGRIVGEEYKSLLYHLCELCGLVGDACLQSLHAAGSTGAYDPARAESVRRARAALEKLDSTGRHRSEVQWIIDNCPSLAAELACDDFASTSSRASDDVASPLLKWAGGEHVTLAIVFTDIVASTKLGWGVGDEEMKAILDLHFDQCQKHVQKHRGLQIKKNGDGVLALFRCVDEALDFALALESAPGDARVTIRAGIHIGPVRIGDDISGRAVNLASRLSQQSAVSGIWLSNRAFEDFDDSRAARHSSLVCNPRPDVVLSGFGPTKCYQVKQRAK